VDGTGALVVAAVIVLPVGLVVLVVVVQGRQRRGQRRIDEQRATAFRGWAGRAGWHYRPSDLGLRDRFRGYPLHHDALPERSLRSVAVRHVLSGSPGGRPVVVFEFAHWFTSGRYGRPGWDEAVFRLAALGLPAACPVLQVTPRPVPLAAAPSAFLARFAVETGDQAFAQRVLPPRQTSWLVAGYDRGPLPAFRFDGHDLLCWQEAALDQSWVTWATGYLDAVATTCRR
jgi:hypothetical protein